MINVKELFEKYSDYSHEFYKVEPKFSNREDLHAFILLDRLLPSSRNILGHAEHDGVCLDIDVDDLAKVATEEDIITLMRCGVYYSKEDDCLCRIV